MTTAVSDTWKRLWTYESNLLSFNQGYHPGHPAWDDAYTALTYAIERGLDKKVALVPEVYRRLTKHELRGIVSLRSAWSGNSHPRPEHVAKLLMGWIRAAQKLSDGDFKVEQEAHKRIKLLHYDLMRIRPYSVDNERLARIMAVNLCFVAEVDPLTFFYEDKDWYMRALLDG